MPESKPTLTLITDRSLCAGSLLDAVRKATIVGGADIVQLREKDLDARELLELAAAIKEITSETGAKLIVNHSIDVALTVDADGIHLGWRSLMPEDVRELLGPDKLVGVSVHSLMELLGAEYGGADYVQFGPIFDTPSKRGLVEPLGVDVIRRAKEKATIPVTVVGGIKEENAADVSAAGADGIAVISAILSAPDPQVAACRLKREQQFGALKRNA